MLSDYYAERFDSSDSVVKEFAKFTAQEVKLEAHHLHLQGLLAQQATLADHIEAAKAKLAELVH